MNWLRRLDWTLVGCWVLAVVFCAAAWVGIILLIVSLIERIPQ